jgi:predicted transcriptional regulator
MRGMSITIELPPDVEKRLAGLPDLGQRVADFLRGQAELEQWREQRYSAKVREIVRESLAEAEAAKARGVSREEAFEEFFDVYDRITAQLAGKR